MGWTNDYHLDINTEQNYWIANVGNLAECHLPLFDYIKNLSIHGAKTAKDLYGCKGWTAHTTANPWGYTAVSGSILWGLFPLHLLGLPLIYGHNMITHKIKIF